MFYFQDRKSVACLFDSKEFSVSKVSTNLHTVFHASTLMDICCGNGDGGGYFSSSTIIAGGFKIARESNTMNKASCWFSLWTVFESITLFSMQYIHHYSSSLVLSYQRQHGGEQGPVHVVKARALPPSNGHAAAWVWAQPMIPASSSAWHHL